MDLIQMVPSSSIHNDTKTLICQNISSFPIYRSALHHVTYFPIFDFENKTLWVVLQNNETAFQHL